MQSILKALGLALGLAIAAPALAGDAAHSIEGDVYGEGTFTGASRHVTTGHGAIIQQDGKWYVSLAEDFFFDGAPDPKVALGNDGYDPDTLLEPLRENTGAQLYEIPASIDVTAYNEIWIWCEQFAVPLGVAALTN
ncbi:MAG: DM13 domain-containing protein [Pseudomonadota bacterium]